jgi:hypothetical protein
LNPARLPRAGSGAVSGLPVNRQEPRTLNGWLKMSDPSIWR